MQCIIMENTLIKLTLHDETKKRAHDSQIVRAKENLMLSHGGSKYHLDATIFEITDINIQSKLKDTCQDKFFVTAVLVVYMFLVIVSGKGLTLITTTIFL